MEVVLLAVAAGAAEGGVWQAVVVVVGIVDLVVTTAALGKAAVAVALAALAVAAAVPRLLLSATRCDRWFSFLWSAAGC